MSEKKFDVNTIIWDKHDAVQMVQGHQAIEQSAQRATRSQTDLTRSLRDNQTEMQRSSGQTKQFSQSLLGIVSGASSARSALAGVVGLFGKSLISGVTSGQGFGSSLASAATGLFSGLFNARGNVFDGGHVTAFAKGGVVNGPTVFPMSGGQTGVMGEAGAEAVMPLRRMSNGRLGVEAKGNKGNGTQVYLDARGADAGAVTRIERALQMLNASVERRALDAVSNRFDRDPSFIRGG